MFVLSSSSLPRTFAAVHHVDLSTLTVTPDFAAGYVAWSAALDLGPEPTSEPPSAPAQSAPAHSGPATKPFDTVGRRERGLEIAATRAIVGFGSVYLVAPSKPSAEPYVVTVTPFGTASCDCSDYRFKCQPRNANCKHGVAVLAQIAGATEGKVAA